MPKKVGKQHGKGAFWAREIVVDCCLAQFLDCCGQQEHKIQEFCPNPTSDMEEVKMALGKESEME